MTEPIGLDYRMPWGAHRGKRLADVPLGYLRHLFERLETTDPRYGRENAEILVHVEAALEEREGWKG